MYTVDSTGRRRYDVWSFSIGMGSDEMFTHIAHLPAIIIGKSLARSSLQLTFRFSPVGIFGWWEVAIFLVPGYISCHVSAKISNSFGHVVYFHISIQFTSHNVVMVTKMPVLIQRFRKIISLACWKWYGFDWVVNTTDQTDLEAIFHYYNWYQLWYGESCSRRTTCLFLMHLLVPTHSRLFLPLRLSHIIQLGRGLVSPDGDEINVKCSFTLFPIFSSLPISFHWGHSLFGCMRVRLVRW